MNITLKGNYKTREVWLNGKPLSPNNSHKVRNHSPDGFSWSYSGSGPSQLALAILLEITNDANLALSNYQQFKQDHIATLPQKDFEVTIDMTKYITL